MSPPPRRTFVSSRADPNNFWDNRFNKRNERAPDFKTKDKEQDVALWLTSRNKPDWVDAFIKDMDTVKRAGGGSA